MAKVQWGKTTCAGAVVMQNSFLRFSTIGTLVFLSSASVAQSPSPTLVSAQLAEVESYVFPRSNVRHQSGERVVVDALLLDVASRSSNANSALLQQDFSFVIPTARKDSKLCVDLAGKSSAFRKMSLLRPIVPVTKVTAHIDQIGTIDLSQGGAMLVAYPAQNISDDPNVACLVQNDWIYPVRLFGSEVAPNELILQLRINSGGGEALVSRTNDAGIKMGDSAKCERESGSNGLYDKICRLVLSIKSSNVAQITLLIGRRDASSVRKTLRVALEEQKL